MITATAQTRTTVQLTLDEDAAKWLQGYLQTFLGVKDENPEHYQYRVQLWHALRDALPKDPES